MKKRKGMVDVIKDQYGLDSLKVLSVMLQIPREKFAPRKYESIAYHDGPVPIGAGQTMSQPYTVAFMTHLITEIRDTRYEKVLEIGTGSGYQAAVLSKLVREVYTIEIIPELAKRARKILKKLKYLNIWIRSGTGEFGWKDHSPYDAIMITAGVEGKVPKVLFNQLKTGGILVAPVGKGFDKMMMRYEKLKSGRLKKEEFGIFHFVPFVGGRN